MQKETSTSFDIQEHLKSGRTFGGMSYNMREPCTRIVCMDGVDLSVQGSRTSYSTPRHNDGPYTHVEVGFPSVKPPDYWEEYAEEWSNPTGTVYAYIPIELVLFFIGAHGGVDVGRTSNPSHGN